MHFGLRFSEFNIARRSSNQTWADHILAGTASEGNISARLATNLRISNLVTQRTRARTKNVCAEQTFRRSVVQTSVCAHAECTNRPAQAKTRATRPRQSRRSIYCQET